MRLKILFCVKRTKVGGKIKNQNPLERLVGLIL